MTAHDREGLVRCKERHRREDAASNPDQSMAGPSTQDVWLCFRDPAREGVGLAKVDGGGWPPAGELFRRCVATKRGRPYVRVQRVEDSYADTVYTVLEEEGRADRKGGIANPHRQGDLL